MANSYKYILKRRNRHVNKSHKKLIRLVSLFLVIIGCTAVLSGCEGLEDFEVNLREAANGLPVTVATYDFNGQKIDQIKSNQVYIHSDDNMQDLDGTSKVIDVDYGDNRTIHVGATMIAWENLVNYTDKYNHKHINIDDRDSEDHSIPFISRLYKDFRNDWSGGPATLVFIKSQSGKPIGTFYGKRVSVHQTDVPDATNFLIDGHRLFCYRCDYTTFPLSVVQSMANNTKVKRHTNTKKVTTHQG